MSCALQLEQEYIVSGKMSRAQMGKSCVIDREALKEAFGRRVVSARGALVERGGVRVTQAVIAARVASWLGQEDPGKENTISQWETGRAMPDCLTMVALADVFGVDPGYLAFGELSDAPKNAPSRSPYVSPADEKALMEKRTDRDDKTGNGSH